MKVKCPKCGWTRKGPGSNRNLVTRLRHHQNRSEWQQCGKVRQFLKLVEPPLQFRPWKPTPVQQSLITGWLSVSVGVTAFEALMEKAIQDIATAFSVAESAMVKKVFGGTDEQA